MYLISIEFLQEEGISDVIDKAIILSINVKE
jgi:hypothetical protein